MAMMLPSTLITLSLLAVMASSENAMKDAIATKVGGDVLLVIRNYKFEMNRTGLVRITSNSPCACRLQCFVMHWCFHAVHSAEASKCSMSAIPRPITSAKGFTFFFKSPFKLAADGLYYFFSPESKTYNNAKQQCEDFGSRMGVARSIISFEIMRALHLQHGMTSAWIGLFQTAQKTDLHWPVDGSLFNTSILKTEDQTLASVTTDTGYYFLLGYLQYSATPASDEYSVICQANYFGAYW
ncbi:C-type lectin-like [Trinorchestia longiramus]|nr:C-type lectin-like [Trinorchestia longiramus]